MEAEAAVVQVTAAAAGREAVAAADAGMDAMGANAMTAAATKAALVPHQAVRAAESAEVEARF